ncbi:hypothetical protein [uncultured Microscilla sp.]|uniref:leucine-rich repeat domain-containing protein n=1 Tax=uncultured Microscilla sp. TaxID=432653 RepID=UPI0026386226|nr:hypothetical protein [uncultured Microscilla sp.]
MEALDKMKGTNPEGNIEKPEEVVKLDLSLGAGKKYLEKLSQFKNLQYLSLESCELGKIPEAVFDLPYLQWLNIVDNKLDKLPKSIGKLIQLRRLDIGSNPFNELPAEIGKLTTLEDLGLANTQIKTYPKEFANLKKLHSIDFRMANVKELPEVLGKLSSLKTLYLHFNPDINSKQAFKVLAKLPNLETLIYNNCNVTILPQEVTQLKNLKNVTLGDKSIELNQVLGLLGEGTKVEDLTISRLKTLPKEIQQLKKIRTLQLLLVENTQAEQDQVFENLQGIASLEYLHVYGKDFKPLTKEIGKLTQLTTLKLIGNSLKTLPEEIKNLTKLKLLDLSSNVFSDQEKARIKKLLPNTEIKF